MIEQCFTNRLLTTKKYYSDVMVPEKEYFFGTTRKYCWLDYQRNMIFYYDRRYKYQFLKEGTKGYVMKSMVTNR